MSRKKTREEFIERANIIHKNKYDYSLVEYVNNKTKIKIICPRHGVFEQTPASHLSESGCKERKTRKFQTNKYLIHCLKLLKIM